MENPFIINIRQSVMDDLKTRIANTRCTDEIDNSTWEYGTNKTYLKELWGYWQNIFDWRKQEAYLNSLPYFKTTVNGTGLDYIHQQHEGKKSVVPAGFAIFLKDISIPPKFFASRFLMFSNGQQCPGVGTLQQGNNTSC